MCATFLHKRPNGANLPGAGKLRAKVSPYLAYYATGGFKAPRWAVAP